MREPQARLLLANHVGAPPASRGHPAFAALLATLDHHPRWGLHAPHERGRIAGLRVVRRGRHAALTLQAHFGARRSRWHAVSWRQGVERRRRDPAAYEARQPERALHNALRNTVSRQLSAWRRRQAGRPACAHCGRLGGELHVDHVAPPFVAIRDAFLAQWAGAVPTAFVGGRGSGRCRLPAGAPMTRAWQRFHARQATYQLLCRDCNLRKGARPMASLLNSATCTAAARATSCGAARAPAPATAAAAAGPAPATPAAAAAGAAHAG